MTSEHSAAGHSSYLQALPALLWHALAVTVVLLAPSELWLHRSIGLLEVQEAPQPLIGAMAYCCYALWLRLAPLGTRARVVHATLGAVMCFGLGALVLSLRVDFAHSRAMTALSCILAVVLALLPHVVHRLRTVQWIALIASVIVLVVAAQRTDPLRSRLSIVAADYQLDARFFDRLLTLRQPELGGGIVAFGRDFLLATGDGDLYRLAWNAADSLVATRLSALVPMERPQFSADLPAPRALKYRVTDLLLDTLSRPARLIVAHQFWNHEQRCLTLRVSAANADDVVARRAEQPVWRTLFDTRPCLSSSLPLGDAVSGGRLTQTLDGQLILSTGDFGFERGPHPFAQGDGDYGKVLLLDQRGGGVVLSKGHRNPQGLVMARSGRLWETEHGPRGGDEINLVVRGGNYGWPLTSYGTQYNLDPWPETVDERDRSSLLAPAYVFVPSVAPTAVIELTGRQFPRWTGDLLVGALQGKGVIRVRTLGDRVLYATMIPLDRRIRDLAEGSDGRVVLWTDGGTLIVLSAGERDATKVGNVPK